MGKLVTIATFDDVPIASIARSKLEAEGIPCFLTNEHTVGMQWFYANALKGVDVQVMEEHAEAALALLTEDFRPENMREDDAEITGDIREGLSEPDARCPHCGNADCETRSLRRATAAFFYLLGLPLVFDPRWRKCRLCGHKWR